MSQAERRKSKRRKILESFSVFVSIPKRGGARLQVHDLSEHGIAFDIDVDGEDHTQSPLERGESLSVDFYLTRSVAISLTIRVARVEVVSGVRKIGGEFLDADKAAGFGILKTFVSLVDQLHEYITAT